MIQPPDESDATHSFNPEYDLQPVMYALNWYVDVCHGVIDVPAQAMPHLQQMTAACLGLRDYLNAQSDTAPATTAASTPQSSAPQLPAAGCPGDSGVLDAAIADLTEQLERSLEAADRLLERIRLWLGARHPLTDQAWRCVSLTEEATIFGGHELRAIFDACAPCLTGREIPRQR